VVSGTALSKALGPRVVVVGDLVVDVVIAPGRELVSGTDVPGRVILRQGGSATTTARWLARGGARVSLIASIGRDAEGRALVTLVEKDGVKVRAVRIAGQRTGRLGVVVAPDGERSFVQDRAAALGLAPKHLRRDWFAGAELVHIPAYSLLGRPLGDAGRFAAELAREAGAPVTVDLSSEEPLREIGPQAAREAVGATRPDVILATRAEALAIGTDEEDLLQLAPAAVIKRGPSGATILYRLGPEVTRLDVAAAAVSVADTTGAGDAFDAGFVLGWLAARRAGRPPGDSLRRGAVAGNRLAARHLLRHPEELSFD
jgi:sugar/nucleoside kinase (ribokinase family)